MQFNRSSAAVLMIFAANAVSPGLAIGAPMTETFDFSASVSGNAPYPTVNGSVTVTFDLAMDQDVAPVDSFSSNLPLGALARYTNDGRLSIDNNLA